MEQLITTLTNFATWAQKPASVCIVLALIVCGYCFKLGGQQGRAIAKGILIGCIVGAILVYGGSALGNSLTTNMKFS
ncbi:hypothetical protein NSQ59_27625 [Margalitia sp. FSL K6-0131]|uniref:hypothetical protein n=1 Tax=Margalitia sp. FSL K6-0131 TaxID=2954604 RepID=UPI0030FB4268